MKKYIHIAKSIKPTLTKEACEVIAEEYSRLRSQDTEHSNMARVCRAYKAGDEGARVMGSVPL